MGPSLCIRGGDLLQKETVDKFIIYNIYKYSYDEVASSNRGTREQVF